MKAVVVTGMPGSGKDELFRMAREYGIPTVRMGDVVRDFYTRSDESANGVPIVEFADSERKRHGADVWAKRTLDSIEANILLIDGCRSNDEISSFRTVCDDITVVSVYAPPSVRYDRLVSRGREDAPKDKGEFDRRDRRELDWGVGRVMALSDIMIPNDSDLESYRKRIKEVLDSIRP